MQKNFHSTYWACSICFVAFISLHFPSHGQLNRPLTVYTTENGLSINSINDLLFDRQGFLWIATADGLQRFDGYSFKTFKHDPSDAKSIADNYIGSLFEDENENLWISHRSGVSVKRKGEFSFSNISYSSVDFVLKVPYYCVGENDSTVSILNYPEGIYAINKFSLKTVRITSLPVSLGQERMDMLSKFRKKEEAVWLKKGVDKTGSIFRFNSSGLREFKNTGKIKVLFIIPVKKDSMVIITDKMIYKASTNNPFDLSTILRSPFDATDLDKEFMTWPRKISNDQYLIIGTKKILMFDTNKDSITEFPYTEYFSENVNHYLNVTTYDRHKNIWLGFNGIGGIKVLSPQKFGLFKRPEKDLLPYCLAADDNNNVYVGIYLGDIEVYDKAGRFLKKIKLPESHNMYESPRAMALIDSSTLIIKFVLDELYAVDLHTGSLQSLSHLLPAYKNFTLGDFEPAMQRAGNNEVLFSFKNMILSLRKNKSGFGITTICTLPVKDRINSFLYNSKGQLLIGTVANAWLLEKNNLKRLSLPFTWVKHINQHPNGNIWITTTDGIYILKDSLVIKTLDTKDGLPNSFVYGVLFDNIGNSWISTNRGLAKIDTAYRITTYSAKEGLQGDEFNTRGYLKGRDGTLYFAGVNGINFFNPQNLLSKGGSSATILTGIEVNNKPYKPDLQPEFLRSVSLPYDQNNIRLSFAYMDLTVPLRNQFKFLLKNFQNDWTLPQTNNTVQYILPPGEYELYVLGANYEGVWSKEPLVVRINILPPWYQSLWAKIIFALLVLGAVGGIFYYISRTRYQKKLRLLQMEQEVQKEKQRLSRDLHDNLGAQISWLSNNISQVETAQQQLQPVEQKMNRLKEGAGELMQTLRETIWILNKDRISAIDFFDKLVSHAVKYTEAYPSIQLHTEETITDNIMLNSSQALQLFRICQEAVTNACKHAEASRLSITASNEKGFTICISDNGKGFDLNNNELTGHYGLQNMKQRAEESLLQLSIESSPGKGASIIVSAAI